MTTKTPRPAPGRRGFLKAAGATAIAASGLAAPAIARNAIHWRMVTTWPKGFPGLGTGAEYLADLITRMTDGRIRVTVYGAGELVPAFEAIDAVSNGTADLGHGGPYYWKGKVEAAQFLSAIPFGFSVQEQLAWYAFGGGQELADRIYLIRDGTITEATLETLKTTRSSTPDDSPSQSPTSREVSSGGPKR